MSPTTTGFASCHKLLLAPFCTKLKCSKSQMAAVTCDLLARVIGLVEHLNCIIYETNKDTSVFQQGFCWA